MRKLVGIGFTMALFACSNSVSNAPPDAANNDLRTTPADAADGGPDLRTGDAMNGPDSPARDVATDPADVADGGGDTPPKLDLSAVDRGWDSTKDGTDVAITDMAGTDVAITDVAGIDVTGIDAGAIDANAIATDGAVASEVGEQCSCGDTQASGPSLVSWGCFCSVESCTRKLADFVDSGDGGRVLKPGQQSVLLLDYAGCNRVVVQAHTYSRYVPASEYAFDRTTGALVGAKVWLDDRQHSCPFPASNARWVFGYQSGSYPIPAACQATDCVPGSGTCPGALDAL